MYKIIAMKKRNRIYLRMQKEHRQFCKACLHEQYNLVEKLKIKKGGKLLLQILLADQKRMQDEECANLEYWQMS